MSKRRVFDIDFPDDSAGIETQSTPPAAPETKSVPAGTSAARRSPMASAISENAAALLARAEAEQAIRDENDALAHEHVRLKKAGLITDLIPLDQIRMTKLTRDRSAQVDPDLEELKASIREIGLSNPIRVEPDDAGGFELVQGFRRLTAYRALQEETGGFAEIPAAIVAHGHELEVLYRKMVDENLVRRDISFGEMAQLAIAYAQDNQTPGGDVSEAVNTLYASASRQKRSYIRRFAILIEALNGHLRFPEALPRALGLDLEKKVSEEAGFAARLRSHLVAQMAATPERELEVLRAFLTQPKTRSAKTPAASRAKTTLRCSLPEGDLKMIASQNRVELAMDQDFSAIDRARLERAARAFVQALKD
ncbi:ParB/RepB/Spo0J family partition protein [Primorskyibacter sp. S187A]|uniref:ParB/RepB/Spo0J family partition protein n=1 Tax=Primorskyibacter sp. S187A TaxID=3415130 RepID=UPI003C7BC6A8